ncbi:uncharacterized protein METZ01_LOCUS436300, partial [marine metagenome]
TDPNRPGAARTQVSSQARSARIVPTT